MIKTVVDLKGTKRFKKVAGEQNSLEMSPNDLNLDVSNISNAKEVFRKLTQRTAYA